MGERKTPKLGTRRIYVDLSTLRTRKCHIYIIYFRNITHITEYTQKKCKKCKKKKKRNYYDIRGGS